MWDKAGTDSPQRELPEPKPPGLGMVSFSKFNVRMLLIVALCSQTVAHFRAKPKLLQTVHKLLQSVAGDRFDHSGQRAFCNRFSNCATCCRPAWG